MTRVKVCGLTNRTDVHLCVRAGVDILGFVVDYPQTVPWNLTVEQGKELVSQVPSGVDTCVVTGGTGRVERVIALAEKIRPEIVQLHHRETLEEIQGISRQLKILGVKTIKALRIDPSGNCDFEIPDPVMAVEALTGTEIWAILVDSYTAARPGGTGISVDLSVFQKIKEASSLPVFLAGGLNPANVSAVIEKTGPYAVDVLTGVEQEPGRKDPARVVGFVKAASDCL